MAVVVGGILEKDGKYLLVQEAKEKCRGKWNLPAGHLDPGETLEEAVTREVREESGYEIEPTAVCQIGHRKLPDDIFVSLVFTTNILRGGGEFDRTEILDVKWFSYEEIIAMRQELRNEALIIGAINNARNGITAPLDIIELY